MNLLPIANKLQTDALGVMGKSIFINMIPVECPRGILLRNPLQGTRIDYELPGYYKTQFKVIVRAQDYADGDAFTKSVFTSLTSPSEQMLGTMRVVYMRPLTLPVVFPLSKGNLLEFSADFEVVYTE